MADSCIDSTAEDASARQLTVDNGCRIHRAEHSAQTTSPMINIHVKANADGHDIRERDEIYAAARQGDAPERTDD